MSENIYRPMRQGKNTEVWNAFVAECATGKNALFHHPSYVCMNREYFDGINDQLAEVRAENGRLREALVKLNFNDTNIPAFLFACPQSTVMSVLIVVGEISREALKDRP